MLGYHCDCEPSEIFICFSLGLLSFVSRIQYVLFLQRKISLGHCIALFLKLIYFFIYFWLPWVFAAARGFSLVAVHGLLIPVASLVWNRGFRARAQWSWQGQVAPWPVGSSWTSSLTCVPCTGKWTPNHCTARKSSPRLVCLLCFN